MPACKYCDFHDAGPVPDGMLHVARVGVAEVLLLLDGNHPGRCVLVPPWHVRDLFDLPAPDRIQFFESLNLLAGALAVACAADKVNIAFFGDMSDHVHAHLVPKWRTGPAWGDAFALQPAERQEPIAGPFTGQDWKHVARSLAGCLKGLS